MDLFCYQRYVAFADTDSMGVVHHANYLHYFEEARVAWMRERGLSDTHYPRSENVLAVLSSKVKHLKTCTFEDLLKVYLQVRRDGLKIQFQYAIYKDGDRIAEGETFLVPMDKNLKPVRPHKKFLAQLEKEKWIETLLSSWSE